MSQEPATTERKADTGPLPPLPTAPGAPPNRRRAKRWPWVAGGVALALAAMALVLLRPPDPMADPAAVETVRGFIAAVESRDATKMLSYVEPTVAKRQIGPEVRTYVEYIEEIRFDSARYELLTSDGERAQVRLTATMRYTVDLGEERRSGERPVDATYQLRKVEGTWYLSGVTLPAT
ncbi:MAG TPA: hypothetical protein VNL77_10815 [Roseiflexaceae bacterium]|nr:hypothetical protein [Roseiflexaceae bacterium]